VVGTQPRALQQREEVLGPVVGGQRIIDQRGQQQRLFAERADDLQFFGHF
jgi:hypothetical protein